jgi:hypothetical protein
MVETYSKNKKLLSDFASFFSSDYAVEKYTKEMHDS